MSVSFVTRLDNLVIAPTTSNSNVLTADRDYGDSVALGIIPITLQAGTFTLQVSIDDGTTWATYQEGSPLAAIALPTVGNAIVNQGIVNFPQLRLHTDTPHATLASTVQVAKMWTAGAGL